MPSVIFYKALIVAILDKQILKQYARSLYSL